MDVDGQRPGQLVGLEIYANRSTLVAPLRDQPNRTFAVDRSIRVLSPCPTAGAPTGPPVVGQHQPAVVRYLETPLTHGGFLTVHGFGFGADGGEDVDLIGEDELLVGHRLPP